MQQCGVKAKIQFRGFLNFMNLSLDKIGEKDLFVLWMNIRKRIHGEQGPLFISDQSLLEWRKRQTQGKKIQSTLGDLLHNT